MKLAVVSAANFIIDNLGSRKWEIHSFSISLGALSFHEMPDSAFSTPARYIQEMLVRLNTLDDGRRKAPTFVFNPLYATNKITMLLTLNALKQMKSASGPIILTDAGDRPAGYFFPAGINTVDAHFLALLSAVCGKTDAALLRHAFSAQTTCLKLGKLRLDTVENNGFVHEAEQRNIYLWVAEKAIAALESRVTADNPAEARRQRDAIPFTAIMPYHAGDALFFTLAHNNVETPISRLAVNQAYQDIVTENASALETLIVDTPPANRGERPKLMPDYAYFAQIRDTLPDDGFYGYFRASRDYNIPQFHLIDHFAFALGRRQCAHNELLFDKKQAPAVFAPAIPAAPVRVLLHFDGGWPLKIYPKALQEALIDRLHAKGYLITVLSSAPYPHAKCQVATFKNYRQFIGLLRAHHILIGMDSFPCHYSAHVLGLPTLCLFASTNPVHSNAPRAVNYRYLERGLRCRPCYAAVKCPIYRKNSCANFVSPDRVADEIDKMLAAVNREQPETRKAPPLNTAREESPCIPLESPLVAVRTERINMKRIKANVLLASVFQPYPRYPSLLYREFAAAIKREGVILALFRTLRYLRRVLRR